MIEIIIAVFCVWMGWRLREKVAIIQLDKMNREVEKIEQTTIEVVKVSIEQHSGRYYAYNYDHGNFMAQGNDWESLQKSLVDLFPNKKFILEEKNLEEVGIKL
jgi:hypothetical protein